MSHREPPEIISITPATVELTVYLAVGWGTTKTVETHPVVGIATVRRANGDTDHQPAFLDPESGDVTTPEVYRCYCEAVTLLGVYPRCPEAEAVANGYVHAAGARPFADRT